MNLLDVGISVVFMLLSLGIVFTAIRLVRGPSLPDRVVAFELFASSGIGLIVTYSIVSGQTVFLDVAIILALISFLGTIAFAYYLEKRFMK